MYLGGYLLILLLSCSYSYGLYDGNFSIVVTPADVTIDEEKEMVLLINFTCAVGSYGDWYLTTVSRDEEIAAVVRNKTILLGSVLSINSDGESFEGSSSTRPTQPVSSSVPAFDSGRGMGDGNNTHSHTLLVRIGVTIRGVSLGRTTLDFYIHPESTLNPTDDTRSKLILSGYRVGVLRLTSGWDTAFIVITAIMVGFITLGMGCGLELDVIWTTLKRPIAPGIGLACQYCVMPLLGFGVANLLGLKEGFGLGLLTVSCSPGGGSSNAWSVLLDGDLNLSITMTFLSTIASLGMMPFWLFVFGGFFVDSNNIEIPFQNIVISLIAILAPVVVGILLRRYKANVALKLIKLVRPMAIIFLIFVLVSGFTINLYMFKLMGRYPIVLPAAALLPWCGFAFGILIALLFRQPLKRAKTIAFETGIQNIGIAIILMTVTLPAPDGDIASVVPVAIAIFTPTPLYIALIVITIRRRLKGKNLAEEKDEKDKNSGEDEQTETDKEKLPAKGASVYSISYYDGPQKDVAPLETSV